MASVADLKKFTVLHVRIKLCVCVCVCANASAVPP